MAYVCDKSTKDTFAKDTFAKDTYAKEFYDVLESYTKSESSAKSESYAEAEKRKKSSRGQDEMEDTKKLRTKSPQFKDPLTPPQSPREFNKTAKELGILPRVLFKEDLVPEKSQKIDKGPVSLTLSPEELEKEQLDIRREMIPIDLVQEGAFDNTPTQEEIENVNTLRDFFGFFGI